MAASQAPSRTRTTASTCTPVTARGTHAFKIAGYSLHRALGAGASISSATFAVGGCDWRIHFYPDGYTSSEEYVDYVAVFLYLVSKNKQARASFSFRLVDQATMQSTVVVNQATPKMMFSKGVGLGGRRFKKKSELEASTYLKDDCLVIECDVTVIAKEPRVEETTAAAIVTPRFEVRVPASDLSENLGKLLEEKRGVDVVFKVQEEVLTAHKIVLAMRSPVFDAELYGPMADNTRECISITIQDMQPDVFRALLYFIYRDSMISMEGFDDAEERKEIIKNLLVAADRYAMERLKLICEGILCKSLDVENVATLLALAYQHHCDSLKNACIKFIASTNRMDNVVASQGYKHLKQECPTILIDVLENVTNCMHSCLR